MPINNVVTLGATGNGSTNDRTAINNAIATLNAEANPHRYTLYFPPGEYVVTGGTLTSADGDYSIVMDAGAVIMYTPSVMAATMWRIGSATAQNDGQGSRLFQLAAETTGAGGAQYVDGNVAFDIVNIKHCEVRIWRANEFNTGLQMTADGENPAAPGTIIGDRHMYNVTVQLGYLHSCRRNLIQRARYNAWANNIRYYNGNFSKTDVAVTGFRYISMLLEGTIGQISRGLENKAVFYEPLCDGTGFTALYTRGSTAMLHGGHMEDPDWVIEHEAGQANVGDEPCVWQAPRLEAKQYLISDPNDVGSYAYDPFWGPAPTPRPRLITSNHTVTTGDVRRQAKIATATSDSTARAVTMPHFGGGSQEPPVGAVVYVQRKGSGALTIVEGSNVDFIVPAGRKNNPVTLRAQGSTAALYFEATGATQIWSVVGDLADP